MKTTGTILMIISIVWLVISIIFTIGADYKYDNTIYSQWTLADKASTIEQKAINVDNFIKALENSNLTGLHDALIFKTPNNSFDDNFKALKTLQQRLKSIQTMNPNSFEYNTAIQQITAQEQGEALEMLKVFKRCWYLKHYPFLWGWVCGVQIVFTILTFLVGLFIKNLKK
jgi:hypothetical protein